MYDVICHAVCVCLFVAIGADDSVRYSFQIWKNFLLRTTESCKLRMEADIAGARSEIMLLQEKVSTLVDQLHTEKEHRKQLQFMNDSMEEQIIELERCDHNDLVVILS